MSNRQDDLNNSSESDDQNTLNDGVNNARLSSESDGDSVSNTSHVSNLDMTGTSEEEEEKQRLIERVLELQSTLEDLSKKVTDVKEENLKLKSENQILGGYIENLMTTSNVFQSTWKK